MKTVGAICGAFFLLWATAAFAEDSALVAARRGFQTKLVVAEEEKYEFAEPPAEVFELISYDSPIGKLGAYLTTDPKDGAKHPAIIWIHGGDSNDIGPVWEPASPDNDQTAAAYRQAGIVMMFPSLRGGNTNPGRKEGFLGEVDDILAAADYLAKIPYVDPARIYLGGHSTGGTLVLLVAECSSRFRCVFSFGPMGDVEDYGGRFVPFDYKNPREFEVRAPIRWLACVKSPVFVFEGVDGNAHSLKKLWKAAKGTPVQCYLIKGRDHFDILDPMNRLIAQKILADTGEVTNIAFEASELAK